MRKIKAQIWFTDFVIGTLIFTVTLIVYYSYIANISKQDTLVAEDLIGNAEFVSTSLLLSGFPNDWDNTTVQSIGITNDNQRINKTKILNFEKLPYNKTKKLLGTIYDYFVFFTNENDTLINVEGICGIGEPSVNVSFGIKAAYYYSDEDDSFLKSFMKDKFDADVYKKGLAGIDLPDFINNINNYTLVVMEHANLEGTDYNNYRDDIENYASSGGFLMLSGQIIKPNDKLILGVLYHKQSGESFSDQNATVLTMDEFLTFEESQKIKFSQAYYVINDSIASKNFTRIARFVDPLIDYPEINNAVARWIYVNGSVFFFSDFDADYFKGNFIDIIKSSITNWIKVKCKPINLNNIKYKSLIKIERFLIYNSKPVKMVIYLWSNI